MQDKTKIIFTGIWKSMALLVAVFAIVAICVNIRQTIEQANSLRVDTANKVRQVAELEAQNKLLRKLKLCVSYPQPNPNDPICGDPFALTTPTPEVHEHGK